MIQTVSTVYLNGINFKICMTTLEQVLLDKIGCIGLGRRLALCYIMGGIITQYFILCNNYNKL